MAKTTHRVNMRRPLSRYWIVALASVVSWWCFQAGHTELAIIAVLWGVSEF